MKYYYEKPDEWVGAGSIYTCSHPMFSKCTLFRECDRGIIVIQEHYNEKAKVYWWGPIDPWLAGDIYLNRNFKKVFNDLATIPGSDGLCTIIQVRKLMWLLRMKPLKREFLEDWKD